MAPAGWDGVFPWACWVNIGGSRICGTLDLRLWNTKLLGFVGAILVGAGAYAISHFGELWDPDDTFPVPRGRVQIGQGFGPQQLWPKACGYRGRVSWGFQGICR